MTSRSSMLLAFAAGLTNAKSLIQRGSVPVIGGPLQILAPCVASCYVQFLPQSGCKSDDLACVCQQTNFLEVASQCAYITCRDAPYSDPAGYGDSTAVVELLCRGQGINVDDSVIQDAATQTTQIYYTTDSIIIPLTDFGTIVPSSHPSTAGVTLPPVTEDTTTINPIVTSVTNAAAPVSNPDYTGTSTSSSTPTAAAAAPASATSAYVSPTTTEQPAAATTTAAAATPVTNTPAAASSEAQTPATTTTPATTAYSASSAAIVSSASVASESIRSDLSTDASPPSSTISVATTLSVSTTSASLTTSKSSQSSSSSSSAATPTAASGADALSAKSVSHILVGFIVAVAGLAIV